MKKPQTLKKIFICVGIIAILAIIGFVGYKFIYIKFFTIEQVTIWGQVQEDVSGKQIKIKITEEGNKNKDKIFTFNLSNQDIIYKGYPIKELTPYIDIKPTDIKKDNQVKITYKREKMKNKVLKIIKF